MKPSIRLLAALVAAQLIAGCNTDPGYKEYIQTGLSEIAPGYTEKYDSIFIVSRMGCNSCKNDADRIVKARLDNSRNLYIFTNLQSQKLLRIEYGKDRLQQPNVIVDKDSRFWKQRYVESAYPVLFTLSDDRELEFSYLLDSVY
ncbi:MAG: hypothetical protein NC082_08420 [Clostridiales bacterium]|nr:hypothetical protein [Clostridiales bacterium]